MIITLEQLKKLIPTNKDHAAWLPIINEYLAKYEINTPERIASFFAQSGHESGDLNRLTENLNYTAQRLCVVFPRYFPNLSFAQGFHRKPELIANRVYNDALRSSKIGNTQEGDGWRFRGRGIFQLTGRTNYGNFAKAADMTPEEAATYLECKQGAMHSACWFWQTRNLAAYADRGDIQGQSKAVNGGVHGLADRLSRYKRNLAALQAVNGLSKGSKGQAVKLVQIALGFKGRDADGDFGKKTETAVKNWQKANGYPVTGSLTAEQQNKLNPK